MDQGRSHATSINTFMHRLQQDNHTTALEFAMFHPDIDFGMEEQFIDMKGFQNPFASPDFDKIAFDEEYSFIHQAVAYGFGSETCNNILKHRRERFFEIMSEDWDIYLSDSLFAVCGYGMAEISGKPHVMMHSTDLEAAQGSFKAFSRNYAMFVPSNLPFTMLDFTVSKFPHRVWATYDWFGSYIFTAFVGNFAQKWALRSIIPFPYFSFTEYNRKSSFSFTDMPDSLFPSASRTNDFFSFGAYCKSSSKPLHSEFKTFIEDPKSKGTILIAFGTFIDWRKAPKHYYETFSTVINQLKDYRVIWSMKGDRPIGLGSHVKTSAWVPQNQILHHNKTVLFLSHGGLKSTKEAICSATPTIFVPLFGEQTRNAWLIKEKGFGRIMSKFKINVNELGTHVKEVIEHPDYQTNANKFLTYYMDQPIPTLDEGAFRFNRLVKYGGRMPDFFYPRALTLSCFTTLNFDLFMLLIGLNRRRHAVGRMSLPTAAQNEVVTLACFLLQNFRSILRFIIEKNPDRNVDPGTVFYSKHDDFLTLNRSVKRIMDRLDREYSYHFWNELNKCLRNVLRFSSRRECRLVEVKTNVLNDLAEQIATGVEFELQIQFEVQEALEALMLYRNENQHDASVSEPEPGPSTPSLKQQMANNLNNGATFCPERQIRKRNEDANSNKRATTTTTTLVAPPLPGLSRQSRGTAVSPSTNTNAHQLSNRRPRNSSNRTGGDGRHRWEPETTSARTARTSMKGYSVFGFDCTSTLNPSNLNARELPSADQHRESRRSGFSSDSDVETPVVTLHQQPSEHHGFSSNEDHSDTDEKNSSELTGVHVKVLDRFSERTSNPGLLEKAAQNSTVRRQTPLASNTTGSSRTESSSSSVPYRTPGSIPSSSLYCSGVENVLNRAKDGLLNEPTASNDNTNGAYTRPKHVSSMNIHAPAFVPSSRRPHLPDLSQPGTSLAYDDHHNATNSSGISQSWQASSRNDQNLRFGDNNSNIERFGQSESNSVSSRTHYGSSSTFHDSNQISPLYRSDPNESFRVIAECAAANCKCYILENHPMTTCHGCRAHYHVSCVNDPIKHALPSNKCKRCGFSLKPNRDDQ